MHRVILPALAAVTLSAVQVPAAAGQDNPFASGAERFYKGGSAVVKVTGSFEIDGEIPLTTTPSYTSDDGQTWIVYGDETSGEPFGEYTCREVDSMDRDFRALKVAITIRFTANS